MGNINDGMIIMMIIMVLIMIFIRIIYGKYKQGNGVMVGILEQCRLFIRFELII